MKLIYFCICIHIHYTCSGVATNAEVNFNSSYNHLIIGANFFCLIGVLSLAVLLIIKTDILTQFVCRDIGVTTLYISGISKEGLTPCMVYLVYLLFIIHVLLVLRCLLMMHVHLFVTCTLTLA